MGRGQQGLMGSVCQGTAAGAVTGRKYSGLKLPSSHLTACPPTVTSGPWFLGLVMLFPGGSVISVTEVGHRPF